MYNKRIGYIGEEIASNYLKKNNYIIIERNYRCKSGEIDIVAKEKNTIIFIEVKTRTNKKYGMPIDAVNKIKQKHLASAINYYLYNKRVLDSDVRFDVIEVILENSRFSINHIKNCNL